MSYVIHGDDVKGNNFWEARDLSENFDFRINLKLGRVIITMQLNIEVKGRFLSWLGYHSKLKRVNRLTVIYSQVTFQDDITEQQLIH